MFLQIISDFYPLYFRNQSYLFNSLEFNQKKTNLIFEKSYTQPILLWKQTLNR